MSKSVLPTVNRLITDKIRAAGLGAPDRAILKVAMLIAAMDGKMTDQELSTFNKFAAKCPNSTQESVEATQKEVVQRAGYLLCQAGQRKKKELVRAFLEETDKILPPDFVITSSESARRGLVLAIAMAMSDGDFCGIEKACVLALFKKFRAEAEEACRRERMMRTEDDSCDRIRRKDLLDCLKIKVERMMPSDLPRRAEQAIARLRLDIGHPEAIATILALVHHSDQSPEIAVFGGSFSRIKPSEVSKSAWKRRTGCLIFNFGVFGAGFRTESNRDSIPEQVRCALSTGRKFGLYLFWGSTNDAGAKIDPNDQVAGITQCVAEIRAYDPEAKIAFFGSSPAPLSELGPWIERVAEIQRKTCHRLKVPFLDQFHASGITAEDAKGLFREDGLHMNEDGYRRLMTAQAEFIAEVLKAGEKKK